MGESKRHIKGFYNWTFLLVVVVALILVNIISSFVYKRFDMTEDQRYSLSSGTVNFLNNTDNFKSRLNIKIYLDGNLPAELSHFRNAIEDKLKEFKQYTGNKIEYQFIDPNVGTEKEQQEVFQKIFAEGKGILPMDLVYMKDGSQSQMMLWPGAIIEYGLGRPQHDRLGAVLEAMIVHPYPCVISLGTSHPAEREEAIMERNTKSEKEKAIERRR